MFVQCIELGWRTLLCTFHPSEDLSDSPPSSILTYVRFSGWLSDCNIAWRASRSWWKSSAQRVKIQGVLWQTWVTKWITQSVLLGIPIINYWDQSFKSFSHVDTKQPSNSLHSILSRRQTRRRRVKQHQHVVSFHNLSPFNLSIPLTIAYLHHTFSTWLVRPQVEWSNKRQEQKQLQHVQAKISRGTFPVPSPLVPPLDLVVEPKRALRAAELALMSFRRNTGMSLQPKVRGNMAKLDMAIMKGFLFDLSVAKFESCNLTSFCIQQKSPHEDLTRLMELHLCLALTSNSVEDWGPAFPSSWKWKIIYFCGEHTM